MANSTFELRGAAVAMVMRELVMLLDHLPNSQIAAALREQRPVTAVAGLLADVALASLISGDDDPLAEALAQGAQRKRTLLTEAGGALSSEAVAALLDVSRQAVDKRRQAGTLLAVPTPGGDWAYPAAQFGADGRPVEGLVEVLRAFRVDDPWMRLAELLAPDEDLEGRSALAALRADGRRAVPAVVAALRTTGEQGA